MAGGAGTLSDYGAGGAGNWGEVAKLLAADGSAGDILGLYVAVSGRRVLAGAEGLARGESAEDVTRAAGMPPFLSGPFSARCRRRPDDLLAMSEAFFEAEAGIKGGGVPHRLATERLVLRLVSDA